MGNVVNTGDSDTPVSGGTTKFTTGGAYTELNKKADKVASATRTRTRCSLLGLTASRTNNCTSSRESASLPHPAAPDSYTAAASLSFRGRSCQTANNSPTANHRYR